MNITVIAAICHQVLDVYGEEERIKAEKVSLLILTVTITIPMLFYILEGVQDGS